LSFRPRFRKEAVLVNVCHLQFTVRVRIHRERYTDDTRTPRFYTQSHALAHVAQRSRRVGGVLPCFEDIDYRPSVVLCHVT